MLQAYSERIIVAQPLVFPTRISGEWSPSCGIFPSVLTVADEKIRRLLRILVRHPVSDLASTSIGHCKPDR